MWLSYFKTAQPQRGCRQVNFRGQWKLHKMPDFFWPYYPQDIRSRQISLNCNLILPHPRPITRDHSGALRHLCSYIVEKLIWCCLYLHTVRCQRACINSTHTSIPCWLGQPVDDQTKLCWLGQPAGLAQMAIYSCSKGYYSLKSLNLFILIVYSCFL